MTKIEFTREEYGALRRLYASVEDGAARSALEATLRAASPYLAGYYYEITNYNGWTSLAYWDGERFLNEWDGTGACAVTDVNDIASAVRLAALPKPSPELITAVARSAWETAEAAAAQESRKQLAELWGIENWSQIRWRDLPDDARREKIREAESYYQAIRQALEILGGEDRDVDNASIARAAEH